MTVKFICGVDYQHEMDEGLADFYDSLHDLQMAKSCWRQCGVVRLLLNEAGEELSHKWVVPQCLLLSQGSIYVGEDESTSDPEQTEGSDPQSQS